LRGPFLDFRFAIYALELTLSPYFPASNAIFRYVGERAMGFLISIYVPWRDVRQGFERPTPGSSDDAIRLVLHIVCGSSRDRNPYTI